MAAAAVARVSSAPFGASGVAAPFVDSRAQTGDLEEAAVNAILAYSITLAAPPASRVAVRRNSFAELHRRKSNSSGGSANSSTSSSSSHSGRAKTRKPIAAQQPLPRAPALHHDHARHQRRPSTSSTSLRAIGRPAPARTAAVSVFPLRIAPSRHALPHAAPSPHRTNSLATHAAASPRRASSLRARPQTSDPATASRPPVAAIPRGARAMAVSGNGTCAVAEDQARRARLRVAEERQRLERASALASERSQSAVRAREAARAAEEERARAKALERRRIYAQNDLLRRYFELQCALDARAPPIAP